MRQNTFLTGKRLQLLSKSFSLLGILLRHFHLVDQHFQLISFGHWLALEISFFKKENMYTRFHKYKFRWPLM